MGKLKCFEIVFTENKTVYHPGERVHGQCIVDIKGEMRMRALRIFMRGVAKVHWTESRSTGTRLGSYTEHYKAEVEYFFKRLVLFDGDRGTLNEGRHEFDFSFEVPLDRTISTSFEGKHGSIRYWLKAEMDKPWALNHKTKRAFTVISPIDINRSEFQIPVENSAEKRLCCWLCTSGPVSITARTDRRGYCPGESIAIWAHFENHTSRTVIPYATLHQTQTFYATGKSRVRATKFTVLTGLPVAAGSRATWDAQLLKIPAVSPSIVNCCLIKVEYYVKVAVHIPGAYNLALNLPITIGTVPHRSGRLPLALPVPPPYREIATPPPPIDDPPPTYVESLGGAVSIRDEDDDEQNTIGELLFTPMYTYVVDYRFRPPPAYSEQDPHPLPAANRV
ncbi:unnamed protein product [Dimorphilus gyrociliatus]|uniref:Arrestin C-terminal-like domain-containing protein n=1 Tax=Dimorphilus gyrociliatus TaxID=2664684 RepID=A0A7I8VSH3_9ANNE|nr:unnamed protein product [Dimorphilus gyrociliatus]